MVVQEAEVPHKIKPGRPHFHFCQVDHLVQVPLPVTPVEGRDGNAGPCTRRTRVTLAGRDLVARDGAKAFALDDDLRRNRGFRVRRGNGLNGTLDPQQARSFGDSLAYASGLLISELGEFPGQRGLRSLHRLLFFRRNQPKNGIDGLGLASHLVVDFIE